MLCHAGSVVVEETIAPTPTHPSSPSPILLALPDADSGVGGDGSAQRAQPRPAVLPKVNTLPASHLPACIVFQCRSTYSRYVLPKAFSAIASHVHRSSLPACTRTTPQHPRATPSPSPTIRAGWYGISATARRGHAKAAAGGVGYVVKDVFHMLAQVVGREADALAELAELQGFVLPLLRASTAANMTTQADATAAAAALEGGATERRTAWLHCDDVCLCVEKGSGLG
ncbi:unnamed protein product [Closterium sp. Yama58-4]|nr:unnamed protein product [Closterium sp. Yama58-4]